MPNLDWRIKYYGVQALAFVVSLVILLLGALPGLIDPALNWTLWLALPLSACVGAVGWWLASRFRPYSARHLSPREWEELRGALEDVPVMSVIHVFAADRSRMERFRYLPLLERYLWGALAEDKVDAERVVRAAFVLHTFGFDMSEFNDAPPLIPDPIVRAWFQDLIAEPGQLKQREHMRAHLGTLSATINKLAADDEAMDSAWRLMLFGELAHQALRDALGHRDPKVREASLGLLEIQGVWPERFDDLSTRIRRDVHPSVQQAAMELLSMEGKKALPVLEEVLQDPFLAGKAEELIQEIQAR